MADGSGVMLPLDTGLVPPAGAEVPGCLTWPAARRSTALSAAQTLTINGRPAGTWHAVQFTSRGTTGGGSLVLANTSPGATGVREFAHPDQIRGVLVRPSGALTLLNDPGAFGP
jgi:hypothetical protein